MDYKIPTRPFPMGVAIGGRLEHPTPPLQSTPGTSTSSSEVTLVHEYSQSKYKN